MSSSQPTVPIFANRQLVVFLDGRKVVFGLEYTDRQTQIEITWGHADRQGRVSLPRIGIIDFKKVTLHSVAAILSLFGDNSSDRGIFLSHLEMLVAGLIEKTANGDCLWRVESDSFGDFKKLCGEHLPGWALTYLFCNDLRAPIDEILGATWCLLRDAGYFKSETPT